MRTHRDKSRLSIEVPVKVHRQLKTVAALNGVSVKDLVLSFLFSSEHLTGTSTPNAETLKAFEESDQGEGLVSCKDIGDLFEKLGLDD